MMLRRRTWQRPPASGDFAWLGHLGARNLLVVAADVVGRGERAALQAGYLRGWLDGFRGQLGVVPDLESVAASLAGCLRSANIDAAYYVASLRSTDRHSVAYEAQAYGFPPPLLLVGPSNATLPSVTPGASDKPQRILLTAPWRLVLASDGLLQRLGSGDEPRGVAALGRWLRGPARDEDPSTLLGTADPPTDDELFVELRWAGWDEVIGFDVANSRKRHDAADRVESFVTRVTGAAHIGRAAAAATAEALDNTAHHGYGGTGGPVQIALRDEGNAARVEVEDSGRGKIAEPGDGTRIMIGKATHIDRWHSESGGVIVSLTFNKEIHDGSR